MGIETTIAPLLRGLTFNGSYGSTVLFDNIERIEKDALIIPNKIKSQSTDSAIKEILAAAYTSYVDAHGSNPEIAVLNGVGSFLISNKGKSI